MGMHDLLHGFKDLLVACLRIEMALLIEMEDLLCSIKKRSSVVKHQMLSNHIFEVETLNEMVHILHGLQLLNFDDKFQFMDLLW